MIGRAFREAAARWFRRRRDANIVQRIDVYTTRRDTTPLRPIIGESGEFVGWTKAA